ncbi:MAG: AAA family ATPase [Terriglobia bacterium]
MNSENVPDNPVSGAKSLRVLRPSIVVLCGPAACGKSTFAKRHFRPTQIISSDWARGLVCDDERDQRFNTQAFALVHFLVEQRLTLNRLCVIDSTALTSQARKELLDLARKHHVPATLVLFSAPFETCVERDEKRERSVGRAIVEHQYQVFEQTKLTIPQEGFDQVVELQDGDLEKVQIEILFRPVVRPEASAPRRFERSARPSQPRPGRPGDGGRSVSPPKAATPRPAAVPAPVANTQSPPAAHPPAFPAMEEKPSAPAPPVVSPKPAEPVVPPPVPSETNLTSES